MTRHNALFVSALWKRRWTGTYRSFYLAKSVNKRTLLQPESGETELKSTAPELDTSNLSVEGTISYTSDPAGVLLRRVFFINDEKIKDLSIGVYPDRS
jgi:hypothetical protein